jgi:hypothetical protein
MYVYIYFGCLEVIYDFILFFFADEMYVLSTSNKKVSIELLGTSEIKGVDKCIMGIYGC